MAAVMLQGPPFVKVGLVGPPFHNFRSITAVVTSTIIIILNVISLKKKNLLILNTVPILEKEQVWSDF